MILCCHHWKRLGLGSLRPPGLSWPAQGPNSSCPAMFIQQNSHSLTRPHTHTHRNTFTVVCMTQQTQLLSWKTPSQMVCLVHWYTHSCSHTHSWVSRQGCVASPSWVVSECVQRGCAGPLPLVCVRVRLCGAQSSLLCGSLSLLPLMTRVICFPSPFPL